MPSCGAGGEKSNLALFLGFQADYSISYRNSSGTFTGFEDVSRLIEQRRKHLEPQIRSLWAHEGTVLNFCRGDDRFGCI